MKSTKLLFAILSMAILSLAVVSAHNDIDLNERIEVIEQRRRRIQQQVLERNRAAFAAYSTTHRLEDRFTSCGNPQTDIVAIHSIQSSRHLCSGCNACVKIDGLLKERIMPGTTIRLQAYKFFFTIVDHTFDLCEMLTSLGSPVRCPIEPTNEGLKACFPLDRSLPTDISASIKVTGLSPDKRPMFCVQGSAWIEGSCPDGFGMNSSACHSVNI
ncbi:hypothetical protein FBU30_005657 [Linnemannia zychae]|nr:hypothetical protein FBU30_005657 [Linnemannia zychae]